MRCKSFSAQWDLYVYRFSYEYVQVCVSYTSSFLMCSRGRCRVYVPRPGPCLSGVLTGFQCVCKFSRVFDHVKPQNHQKKNIEEKYPRTIGARSLMRWATTLNFTWSFEPDPRLTMERYHSMKRMSQSCMSGGRQPSLHDMKSMISVVSLSQGCTPNPCHHILNFILQYLPAQSKRRVQLESLIHRHHAKSLTVFNGGVTLSHGTRQAFSTVRIGIYALIMTICYTHCRPCNTKGTHFNRLRTSIHKTFFSSNDKCSSYRSNWSSDSLQHSLHLSPPPHDLYLHHALCLEHDWVMVSECFTSVAASRLRSIESDQPEHHSEAPATAPRAKLHSPHQTLHTENVKWDASREEITY